MAGPRCLSAPKDRMSKRVAGLGGQIVSTAAKRRGHQEPIADQPSFSPWAARRSHAKPCRLQMQATKDDFVEGKASERVALNRRGFGQQRTHGNSPCLPQAVIKIGKLERVPECANRIRKSHSEYRPSLEPARRMERAERGAISAHGANDGSICDIGLTVFADEIRDLRAAQRAFSIRRNEIYAGNTRSMKQLFHRPKCHRIS